MEMHQLELGKKFEEWEKVFKTELEKARDKAEFYRLQMDTDKQKLHEQIESQEEEIKELKLQLTSKDMELENRNLQYDELEVDEDADQTIDEGNEEETKFGGLSGEFNRRSDSMVENDADTSQHPLVEGETSEL